VQIAIIAGSHRHYSQSDRIARYIQDEIARAGHSAPVVSLAGNPFPLWDEDRWAPPKKPGTGPTEGEEENRWDKVWTPTSQILSSSSGFVIITPEWGGMVPAGLKNFFLLCQDGELAHKPALIVSVSSGIGGSYPIAELRTSSYKNTRICYIPEQVIIRSCQSKLHDENGRDEDEDHSNDEHDALTRDRITYSISVLLSYARALTSVRESGVIDAVKFPFGM
jgi:NAD(P)H-dependent FMN reductase